MERGKRDTNRDGEEFETGGEVGALLFEEFSLLFLSEDQSLHRLYRRRLLPFLCPFSLVLTISLLVPAVSPS